MRKVTSKSVGSGGVTSLKKAKERFVYSPPKHKIIGDIADITLANGTQPPVDSETTVSGNLS